MHMYFANFWVGNLSIHQLPTNPITAGGAVFMTLILLAILGYITYKRRWKWLWTEWLTSLDAKKIGVRKGQVKGIANLGPGAWFIVCLFLWVLAFPMYLVKRPEFIKANT